MQTERNEASQEDTTEFLQYVSGQKDSESGEKGTWNVFVKSDTDHLSSDNQMEVATPQVLCSVLGSSLQERHRGTGMCPEKGNKLVKGLENNS